MIKLHHVDFAITTYCQAKCRSCMRTDEDTGNPIFWLNPSHMSYEDFDTYLKNCEGVELERIEFCGELGDPMMHPEISKFVDRALQQCNSLLINTNGGLRQPKWYAEYARIYGRKIEIVFNIDGADHDTNWKYREGVNFQRAWDNLNAWISNGGWGTWAFLVFTWNVQQIKLAKQMADDNGIPIVFKINDRDFGLITQEQRTIVDNVFEEMYE